MKAGKGKPQGQRGGGGTLLSLLGNRLQVRGLTGGRGCNNLKTGGDSGSSLRNLCRGEGMEVFTRICTKCPAPARGRKGGSSMRGRGGEGICLSDPHSQPPQILQSLGSVTLPIPCPRPNSRTVGRNGSVLSFPFCPCLAPKVSTGAPWHGEGDRTGWRLQEGASSPAKPPHSSHAERPWRTAEGTVFAPKSNSGKLRG